MKNNASTITGKLPSDSQVQIRSASLTKEQEYEIKLRLEKYIFPALGTYLNSPSSRALLTGAAKCSAGKFQEKAEFYTSLILERGELSAFLAFAVANIAIECTPTASSAVEYVVPKVKEFVQRDIEKYLICLG